MSIRFFTIVSCAVAGATFLLAGCVTIGTGRTAAGMATPSHIDSAQARACVIAAANKYYLPVQVIQAVDSRTLVNSSTQITLKVDLRSAVCTISSSGQIRSVVDTTPKSADQIEAEKAAQKA